MSLFSKLLLARKPCLLLALCIAAGIGTAAGQRPKQPAPPAKTGTFYTCKYSTLFREAGYNQADIDKALVQHWEKRYGRK